MSSDVFLQRFRAGDAAPVDEVAFRELLDPHLAHAGTADVLLFGDGTADVHGLDHLSRGLRICHACGCQVWNWLIEAARWVDLTILPVGGPAVVTAPTALAELPAELRAGARVVTTGRQLRALVPAA